MKIDKLPDGRYRVRWYAAGRGSSRPQRTFDRKKDAERFATEIARRKQLGELGLFEQSRKPVEELAPEWWRTYAVPNLADWTLNKYERMLSKHIQPRLGRHRVNEVTRRQRQRARVPRDPPGDVPPGDPVALDPRPQSRPAGRQATGRSSPARRYGAFTRGRSTCSTRSAPT